MFCKFSDDWERRYVIDHLVAFVNGTLDEDTQRRIGQFCKIRDKRYSEDLELLKRMLAEYPEDRPHAEDVAGMNFLKPPSDTSKQEQEIASLGTKLKQAEEELRRKQDKIDEQKRIIRTLTSQNKAFKKEASDRADSVVRPQDAVAPDARARLAKVNNGKLRAEAEAHNVDEDDIKKQSGNAKLPSGSAADGTEDHIPWRLFS